MLVISFLLLLAINALQAWTAAPAGRAGLIDGTSFVTRPSSRAYPRPRPTATGEPALVRALLIAMALAVPHAVPASCRWRSCFVEGLKKGLASTSRRSLEPDAVDAIKLTLLTAAIAVPLNLVFGVAAAWSIAKFEFPRQEPADHADRPAVLGVAGHRRPDLRADLRRCRDWFGPWLREHDLKIIFARAGHRARDDRS